MNRKNTQASLPITNNRLARAVNLDPPATAVLAAAHAQGNLPVQIQVSNERTNSDYTQIDPTLTIEPPPNLLTVPHPRPGVGYAGLTPQQRYQFLHWLNEPTAATSIAFQQLYLAHLEVGLFENQKKAQTIHQELLRLQHAPAWQQNEALSRTRLLSYWLAQDGPGLASWLHEGSIASASLGIATGHLSLLREKLNPAAIIPLLQGWQMSEIATKPAVLALRLHSLTANLGAEPLAYALANLGEAALKPRTWRCLHRDLRIVLPQPDLRPFLAPLLAELISAEEMEENEPLASETPEPTTNEPTMDDLGWHLILEFGHSRSEFFEFALELAQRMETYTQIADENRKLVHRVIFKKRDLRPFWRLWDYVQSWSSTQVFINGEEFQKWKIYPYSPYLK